MLSKVVYSSAFELFVVSTIHETLTANCLLKFNQGPSVSVSSETAREDRRDRFPLEPAIGGKSPDL